MIIIVKRSDLSSMYKDLEPDFVGLQHFSMSAEKNPEGRVNRLS